MVRRIGLKLPESAGTQPSCGKLAGRSLLVEREKLGLVLSLIAAWQITPGRRDPPQSQHCQPCINESIPLIPLS